MPDTGCGPNSAASPMAFGGRDDGCCRIATSAVEEPSNSGTNPGATSGDSGECEEDDDDGDVGEAAETASELLLEGDGDRELLDELLSSAGRT